MTISDGALSNKTNGGAETTNKIYRYLESFDFVVCYCQKSIIENKMEELFVGKGKRTSQSHVPTSEEI